MPGVLWQLGPVAVEPGGGIVHTDAGMLALTKGYQKEMYISMYNIGWTYVIKRTIGRIKELNEGRNTHRHNQPKCL